MNQSLVPVDYATRLLARAKQSGCNVDELLDGLGLSKDYFGSRTEIPALKYGELYQQVMRYTQDEWFGIFAEGKVPLGAFRLMCLTLLSCSDLKQATIRAGEFAEVCRGLMVRYLLSVESNLVTLALNPSRSLDRDEFDRKIQSATPDSLMASLMMWHRLSEWLIGMEIPIVKITVTFSGPQEQTPFDMRNIKHVEYGALQNSVSYDPKFLEYPIVQNQDALMAFLRTAPYRLVTEDPSHVGTADKVRNILKRDVSGNMPSAEAVASQLNVSVTTLRRQLQKDQTSYQKLKDECRMEAAFHYLGCFDLSNTMIAEMLGFDEPSAFFRSFKKWTGKTPGEYRATIQQDH